MFPACTLGLFSFSIPRSSIPTGLHRAGSAGSVGFQQNWNIQGELAQASMFVFLKGTTAPTGSLGWRAATGGGCSPFSLESPLLSLHYCAFSPSVCSSSVAAAPQHHPAASPGRSEPVQVSPCDLSSLCCQNPPAGGWRSSSRVPGGNQSV